MSSYIPRRPPEPRSSLREKILVVGLVAGCLYGAVMIWVVIIGLPIAIYHGLTTGDWTPVGVVGVIAVSLWLGFKLGWIQPLND